MRFAARRALGLKVLTAVLLFAVMLSGCSRRKSAEQLVDQFFQDNPTAKRFNLARFAGRVTIDGMPPEKKPNTRLFILLNDPEHPERLPTRHMEVADDGTFSFMTYLSGDGVPVGKYIVEFAQLHAPRVVAQRGGLGGRLYKGPDDLKNLYNDPDKNKEIKDFIVDVQPPGRNDYEFNLAVAGKDPVVAPGKHAATAVPGY